jgi:hypothetical protein
MERAMQPTTRQKMAKPIPTTKPTRKPKNNTKHQRGDKNGLKLTGPHRRKKRPNNIPFKITKHTKLHKTQCLEEA